MSVSARTAPFHRLSAGLGPLVVWDVVGGREDRGRAGRGVSLQNHTEADFCASLYRGVCTLACIQLQERTMRSIVCMQWYRANILYDMVLSLRPCTPLCVP